MPFIILDAPDGVDLSAVKQLMSAHVRRANKIFAGHIAEVMDAVGIRQPLFRILVVIGSNPGINQGLVGRSLGIQRGNMVALINELVDGALIVRKPSRSDGRAFSLEITDKGREMLEVCMSSIFEREEKLLAHFEPGERDELMRLLGKIDGMEWPNSVWSLARGVAEGIVPPPPDYVPAETGASSLAPVSLQKSKRS